MQSVTVQKNMIKFPFEFRHPNGFVAFVALTALAFAVHAAVLAWVYPGFYDPLWPNHSDFYIGPVLAHAVSYLDLLFWPRPVGMIFAKISGYLGIRGAIASNLLLVILNCTITATILRRVTELRLTWPFVIGFVLYTFLVFSHPFQYVWSTYDVLAQLSYFLLACAVCLREVRAPALVRVPILFGLMVLAFLAKETFVLSALFLIASWWWLGQDRSRAVRIGIALVLAMGFSLAQNWGNRSIFLGAGATAGSPYHSDFSVPSLVSEWMRYAGEGMSLWMWGFVVVTGFLLYRSKIGRTSRMLAVLLPVAGMLAWLPNSALPHHHHSGYSFSGSYLIFAPVLLLGALWTSGRWARCFFIVIGAIALASPLSSTSRYASNAWVIEQQLSQKRLLSDLGELLRRPPSSLPRSVLVTGIHFPFSPFDHGQALFSLGNVSNTNFNVLAYAPRNDLAPANAKLVSFITPETALHGKFDEVWMFRSNGSLVRSLHVGKESLAATFGFTPSELMMFPDVAEALGVSPESGENAAFLNDGYRLLQCGTSLLFSYQQPALALRCLDASVHKIPENPYPYFYSGLALEQLNRMDEAKSSFEQAVDHDNVNGPNPAFKEALQRSAK